MQEVTLKHVAQILAPMLAAGLFVTIPGCREDAESPSAPEVTSALSAASAPLPFRQVSAGWDHTCGVTIDDRAYCWGNSQYGQLGNGTFAGPETCYGDRPCSPRPVAVLGGLRFRHVIAGTEFTCGLTTNNRAYCWGGNASGQLGDGTTTGRSKPVAVAGGRSFLLVRAGGSHACAIDTSHAAFCWGSNSNGQLGDGTTTRRLTPVRVSRGLSWGLLTGGFIHTCGMTTDNHAYCWGDNGSGRLGDGTTVKKLKPAAISGGLLVRQIEAGYNHTCAVAVTEYRAYCWGSNYAGGLGDGTTTTRLTPTAVAGDRRFDNVSAGVGHTCGVTRGHRGLCWGTNPTGQLGNGATFRRATPTPLAVDLQLGPVSAGLGFTCGVTTGDRAYCWGENSYGQIGDGTSANTRLTPVAVVGP
jgi:alpha-tubulin suppressor-like RCC1 family protein